MSPPPLLRLLRPGNALMAAAGVAVGAHLAGGLPGAGGWSVLALAAGAAFAFSGAGNARNDLLDVEVDRAAHPDRPLVTGAVSLQTARRLVAVLYGLAFAAVIPAGLPALVLVGVALVLMEGYERWLKAAGLPGNVVVGLLSTAPFLLGSLVSTGTIGVLVVVVSVLAFLASLGREVLKDVEDAAADRGVRRTLAARGRGGLAEAVAAAAFVGVVVLSPLPLLPAVLGEENVLGWAYLPAVVAADAAFLTAAWRGTRAGVRQRLAKVGMLLALAALVAGRVHAGWWTR